MSVTMRVTVRGKENIEKVKAAGSKIRILIPEFLATSMHEGYIVSYTLCPVKTGYLRSTLNWFIQGCRAFLEATAEYAGFVEFGTRRMAARAFLRPGADEAVRRFTEKIRELPERVFG